MANEKLESTSTIETIEKILDRYPTKDGILISALQDIQNEYGYLPRESVETLAKKLKIPLSSVYGVATFFSQFHLSPRGENVIRTCLGTACHVRGGAKILEKLQEVLNLDVGGTTEDMKYTLESVACIGACGLAPVLMINNDTFGRLTPEKIPEIINNYEKDSK